MRGEPALSEFRLQKLKHQIFELCGVRERPAAHFVYLIDAAKAFSGQQSERLENLLHAERIASLGAGATVLVIPRVGTQSPWSSKATDIARRCHLEEVNRVERGVAYRLPELSRIKGNIPARVQALLHDRMTQTVVLSLDAARGLFEHHAPASLERVPVSADGLEALQACNRRLGLALSEDEMEYLARAFERTGRDP
jgi:phosphoribosylformylglycinamidine synthase